MATFRDAVKRLKVIYEACAPQDGLPLGKGPDQDEFTATKRKIHEDVKRIRQMLKEREGLTASRSATVEAAEASYRIRIALKEVREVAQRLADTQAKEEKKADKKGNEEAMEKCRRRREIVQLVWSHIEECEALEKKRVTEKVSGERTILLSGGAPGRHDLRFRSSNGPSDEGQASSHQASVGYRDPYLDSDLPDIDVAEDFKQMQINDQMIDRDLEEIKMGVGVLKDLATGMETELDKQNQMLDDVTVKVDTQTERLDHVNVKMKMAVEKVMKGDHFLLNCILLCVLLCLVAFIATVFL
ncbi:hypothetical protein DFJ74DRAFT_754144 [Hyaloraphidium curvatum]|nr:hypothetical protein DFJ74DRAFT_754144 [Hyaloraphidium curvatum]